MSVDIVIASIASIIILVSTTSTITGIIMITIILIIVMRGVHNIDIQVTNSIVIITFVIIIVIIITILIVMQGMVLCTINQGANIAVIITFRYSSIISISIIGVIIVSMGMSILVYTR